MKSLVQPNCLVRCVPLIRGLSSRLSNRSHPFSTHYAFQDQVPIVEKGDPVVERLSEGLKNRARWALAESITLVESRHPLKRARGNALLSNLMKEARNRYLNEGKGSLVFRVGLSGPPGVGKSSFIEAFGEYLTTQHNKNVAVLTVDPSSKTTGGSLLGDLTRMTQLSRNPKAYIRSSPNQGMLGGVTRGTQEAIILCEAAGYDVVLVETVGVGQSEVAVADMVDMFCLLISPAHGDELQGIKRGVVELTDLVLVTKADGELMPKARITQAEYISALKYIRPRSKNWRPKVQKISAHKVEGLKEAWESMTKYRDTMIKSGEFLAKRERQLKHWVWEYMHSELMEMLRNNPDVRKISEKVEKDVVKGEKTPGYGAELLLVTFLESLSRNNYKY